MNLDFNKICRLCLRLCEQYVDLNQTNGAKTLSSDLAEKIKFCYVLQIDLSQEFPTKVCYECIQVVSFFYTAKKNILISEKLLKDVVYSGKKLKKSAESTKKNVSNPEIVDITQKKEKSNLTGLLSKSVLKTPEPNISPLKDNRLNYSKRNVSTTGSGAFPKVNCEKELVICEPDTLLVGQTLESSGDSRDLKKLKHHQRQTSKAHKDKLNKTTHVTNAYSKENIFKEIGTVIDASNILSPNAKRPRKSAG